MLKRFLNILLLAALLSGAALAETVNGGWSMDNGGLLILLQGKKGTVVGVDIGADKQVRHLFLGTASGGALALQTQDGAASLDASVADGALQGTLTESGTAAPVNATLSFAYKGSAYDGLWQLDGGKSYLAYATLLLKGAKLVMAPYFAADAGQATTYNLFMGQTVTNRLTGAVSYQGISVLDLSTALELKFSSASAANGGFTQDGAETSFAAVKIKPVAKP